MSLAPHTKSPTNPGQLLQAARRFGTPTYVYDEGIVRSRCRQLRTHLDGLPLVLLYAMKANPHPALLEIFLSEGYGIDAVSPAELALALRVGFPPEKILYSANNMTDGEMHEVARQGILMNIGEPSRLESLGDAYPGSRVCLRLNPTIGSGHHEHVVTAGKRTKFGIQLEDIGEVLDIARRHRLHIAGIHQHIGSGIPSIAVLRDAMHLLIQTASAFPNLEFINFGGGFNVPYRAGDQALDLENFQSVIVEPLRNRLPVGVTCWFEPGRFLVAESGTLLVQATTLKESHGIVYAGTDSGMAHLLRPALYDAYHEIVNLSDASGEYRSYTIVGNICESGDVLARDRMVRTIHEGDIMAIMDTGAYGMAMASMYNLRPLPAEVLARPNGELELIQPRLATDELLAQLYGHYLSDRPQPV